MKNKKSIPIEIKTEYGIVKIFKNIDLFLAGSFALTGTVSAVYFIKDPTAFTVVMGGFSYIMTGLFTNHAYVQNTGLKNLEAKYPLLKEENNTQKTLKRK